MAIQSKAFGRVKLTKSDAKKFRSQVTYGRPKAAAVEAVQRGVELARALQKNGKVTLTIPLAAKGQVG